MPAQVESLRNGYLEVREVCKQVSEKLLKNVGMDVFKEGARRLGQFKDDKFLVQSESAAGVVMDYCLYDVRVNGRNALETYLVEHPPEDDSPKSECLRRMQRAEYGIHIVESVEPQLGVYVRDAVRGTKRLIVDLGMARTMGPGVATATRLLHYEDFSMTSGAPLFLPVGGRSDLLKLLVRTFEREGESLDPANIIRPILERGGAKGIAHIEARESLQRSGPATPQVVSMRIGRNDPCPCGSGRKYKQCCIG